MLRRYNLMSKKKKNKKDVDIPGKFTKISDDSPEKPETAVWFKEQLLELLEESAVDVESNEESTQVYCQEFNQPRCSAFDNKSSAAESYACVGKIQNYLNSSPKKDFHEQYVAVGGLSLNCHHVLKSDSEFSYNYSFEETHHDDSGLSVPHSDIVDLDKDNVHSYSNYITEIHTEHYELENSIINDSPKYQKFRSSGYKSKNFNETLMINKMEISEKVRKDGSHDHFLTNKKGKVVGIEESFYKKNFGEKITDNNAAVEASMLHSSMNDDSRDSLDNWSDFNLASTSLSEDFQFHVIGDLSDSSPIETSYCSNSGKVEHGHSLADSVRNKENKHDADTSMLTNDISCQDTENIHEKDDDLYPSIILQIDKLRDEPSTSSLSNEIAAAVEKTSSTESSPGMDKGAERYDGHEVVIAIDFGTTYSGYAFAFTHDPQKVFMMRKWDDRGVFHHKTLTSVLLDDNQQFHSFGFVARDHYHNLSDNDAKMWYFFEKFKMHLHHQQELRADTELTASNGRRMPALTIFSHALWYLKEHALKELADCVDVKTYQKPACWVITVPALWKQQAKQFMRQAAYNMVDANGEILNEIFHRVVESVSQYHQLCLENGGSQFEDLRMSRNEWIRLRAGLADENDPHALIIALEPEAASLYCRSLKKHQLQQAGNKRTSLSYQLGSPHQLSAHLENDEQACVIYPGSRYMVVDCGGGTVDITVHQVDDQDGRLSEIHKASGGPYGSLGVDREFEKLLGDIFGEDFIARFKVKHPVGWIDFLAYFESRKRAATTEESRSSNIYIPFTFKDFHEKFHRDKDVKTSVARFSEKGVKLRNDGMMRLEARVMRRLFQSSLEGIVSTITEVINNSSSHELSYMFLVGGFAESAILQNEIEKKFGADVKVIVPQEVSLAVLKGAAMYGLDPNVINMRRSRFSYGVGVLKRFQNDVHSVKNRIRIDGVDWCNNAYEEFVAVNQPIVLGESVRRSYNPVHKGQNLIKIRFYSTPDPGVKYITDASISECGILTLDLGDGPSEDLSHRCEVEVCMMFGETEIRVSAIDKSSGTRVKAMVDFFGTP